MAATTRRMRAFKRWMKTWGVSCSDALDLVDSGEEGIWVRAICPLREGDLVASIPKDACLTIKTCAAGDAIEAAGLSGALGLAVALMYERSLAGASRWAGYLQLLPEREQVPVVWSVDEVDRLLLGTELHAIVKEDQKLLYEDWKENIQPLVAADPMKFNLDYFGAEQFSAAKSLVASRSFQIDNFHGHGMVPLADLFNHKTGDEDVHFTSFCSVADSSDDDDNGVDDGDVHDESIDVDDFRDAVADDKSSLSDIDVSLGDDPTKLEMIIVQNVEAGAEVYNTYGSMGNAALLHRYGFTEPENPFDIVNIDICLVNEWSSRKFSSRYFRRRLSLWRKLNYSGCISQKSEYFEITSDGEPQLELLVLLYMLLLNEDAYQNLDNSVHNFGGLVDAATKLIMSANAMKMTSSEIPDCMNKFLLTADVADALVSLANIREHCYGVDSLEEDWNKLGGCCCVGDKKLYHSLVLRISERTILCRLREYASRYCKAKKRKLEAAQ